MKAILCLFFTTLSFCVAWGADAAKRESENAIKEATFRYQFLHLTPEQQRVNAKFYVLSYGAKTKGPDEEFLKRFATNSPPIKEGALVLGTSDGWFAKGTKDQGLSFVIAKIQWVSDSEVAVVGACEETASRSSWHTYHLKKETANWTVSKVQ